VAEEDTTDSLRVLSCSPSQLAGTVADDSSHLGGKIPQNSNIKKGLSHWSQAPSYDTSKVYVVNAAHASSIFLPELAVLG